jgi:hypothetical protein
MTTGPPFPTTPHTLVEAAEDVGGKRAWDEGRLIDIKNEVAIRRPARLWGVG